MFFVYKPNMEWDIINFDTLADGSFRAPSRRRFLSAGLRPVFVKFFEHGLECSYIIYKSKRDNRFLGLL